MGGPLEGLRVVDSTDGRGELCGRLLADLGADVILIEAPEGSTLRRSHPRSPGGHSLSFAWRNANKRSRALDTRSPSGRAELMALLGDADVWIESDGPRPGLDPAEVAAQLDHLVVTSITPFGLSGPYSHHVADDDALEAYAGMIFKAGVAAKPPLLPPTPMATDVAAVVAALATSLALHQRLTTGRGQHVDLAIMTAAAATTDWSYINASVMRASGQVYNEVRCGGGFMYPIFACRDGYVRMVILSPRQWAALWDWMGRPAAFADEGFWSQVGNRIMNSDVLNPAYADFFADKHMGTICEEGQNRGIVITPLLTPAEVLADPHFRARDTFTEAEVAPGVRTDVPSGFFEIDGIRQGFRDRAPHPDQHPDATFDSARMRFPAPGPKATAAPLAGIRVLDFGIGGVGVEASRVLAEYGADVIKIESRTYPDFIRLIALSEMSPSFASSSRSKRSLGLNVKTERGRELAYDLVAGSDVLIENSATATMPGLGLGYDDLRRINPDLVMVSSQLVGSRGPNAHWTGYGPTTQTYGGLLHLWDYDDDDPPAANQTIYPDHLAGRLCALAAVTALVARAQGRGGAHAEVAQVEVVVNMLAERLMEEALAPGSARPTGNRSSARAPRGVYPCAGDEQWAVISVASDDHWRRLQELMGRPDWAADARFDHVEGRLAGVDELDTLVAAWTSTIPRRELVARLQHAGIPAGEMLTGTDMLSDPHLAARGWTIAVDQPGVGPLELEGPAWVAADMAGPVTTPAPGLGQHTREIAAEVLGLDPTEIDELVAAGVLETDPAS